MGASNSAQREAAGAVSVASAGPHQPLTKTAPAGSPPTPPDIGLESHTPAGAGSSRRGSVETDNARIAVSRRRAH